MHRPLRILRADDDRHVRAGVRAFLTAMLPCEIVAEAADGKDAIEQVAHYQPDAVVLDLHMPVLDRVEATRLIKAQWPAVAIVVLTIYAGRHAAALTAGADAFVGKGDPVSELVQALQSVEPHAPLNAGGAA